MSPAAADRLGVVQSSSVVIWNPSSRAAIDAALSAHGLVNTTVRIRRSWEPFDPDSTIGMARTKQALGEFAYRVNGDGSVTLDSDVVEHVHHLRRASRGSRLSSGCNVNVRPALQAAMNEVVAAGLAGTIDYADANTCGRLLRAPVQPADPRLVGRVPLAPRVGTGDRHEHAGLAARAVRRPT